MWLHTINLLLDFPVYLHKTQYQSLPFMVLQLKNQRHVLIKYRLKEAQHNAYPRFGTEPSVAEKERKKCFILHIMNRVTIFWFHQFEQSAVIILNIVIISPFHHTPSLCVSNLRHSTSTNGFNVWGKHTIKCSIFQHLKETFRFRMLCTYASSWVFFIYLFLCFFSRSATHWRHRDLRHKIYIMSLLLPRLSINAFLLTKCIVPYSRLKRCVRNPPRFDWSPHVQRAWPDMDESGR